MGEKEAVEILKGQGMTQEEAEDFVAGVKRGVKAMHEGDRIPWDKVKKELGLDEGLLHQFWDKWYHADELDRLKLVEQLTGVEDPVTVVLVNSYFVDLVEYLEKTLEVQKGGKNNG